MKKLFLVLALFLCAGIAWFWVGRATATKHGYSLTLREANEQNVLLITVGSEPRTLDPQEAQGVTEHHIIMAMIEGLVAPSIDDQSKVVPGMADHWEHNEDASIWTFHIGADRRWSNGEPVKAGDFVFSYKRMLTASFGAQYAENLFILKGAEDYYSGKTTDFDQFGVKALDDRTFQDKLVGRTPYLLSLVQHDSWLPVCPAAILKL